MANTPKSFQYSQARTKLSDFCKMCLILLKVFYIKQKPHIQYRSYKKFSDEALINDVQNTFFLLNSSCENCLFEKLKKTVDVTLKRHARLKKRYVRASQAPFINKTITKNVMKQSPHRNKFLNTKSEIDKKDIASNVMTALLSLETFFGNRFN